MEEKTLIEKQLNKLFTKAVGLSRVALYTVEGLPIVLTRKLLGAMDAEAPPKGHEKELLLQIKSLIDEDAENIADSIYPESLLLPEAPKKHATRYLKLMADSIASTLRAKDKINKSFSKKAQSHLKEVPDYYKRNFHFQTDGYLSKNSAELYNHQTEILFRGTLGLMRRLLIAELIKTIRKSKKQIKILEIASGAGELTEILLKSCDNIEITCLDLSQPYLDHAQEKLSEFSNLSFTQGNAAKTKFKSGHFDYVVSSFLFHELPEKERESIITESFRVLKPKGQILNMDSLQLNDNKDLNWALEQFPKNFHEPFYANYTKKPLEKLYKKVGFKKIKTSQRLLSKAVVGTK